MTQEINKEELNLRNILKPYLNRWYWFAIGFITMVVLAYFYIKSSQPVYKIQSSVLIKDAKKMSSASGDFGVLQGLAGFGGMGTNSIENELEIFKSKQIIEEVIANLKLQTPLFSREKNYDVELYKSTSPVIIQLINEKPDEELPKKEINISIKGEKITLSSEELKKDIVTTYNTTVSLPYANIMIIKNPDFNLKKVRKMDLNDLYFTYTSLETLSDNIQEALKVDLLDKNATVIGLSMNSSNKEKTKDFLNALTEVYNNDATSDKNTESKKTKDFIDERISIISQELGNVESEKERFKIQNNIVDIPTEARMNLQKSEQARASQLSIDTQLEITQLLLNYLNNQSNNDLLPVNIGLSNEAAGKSIENYNALILKKNKLLENATPQNPLVVDANAQIANMKKAIQEGLIKNKTTLNLSRKQLESEYGSSISNIQKVPAQEKLFRSIERQQQIKENLYLLLLQKREEAAISLAMTANKARIIDQAYVNKKPVAPKKMIILLSAGLIGVLLPFGYIYLKELFNNKIIDKDDLELLSDNTVLAEIPRLSKNGTELIQSNDVTPLAESFRILGTNLKFLIPKKDKGKTILITSSVKGEGKTFVSVNLALSLSGKDKRVIIVGSDIRNPQLQRYDPDKKGTKGLTEYLYGEISDEHTIIHKSIFSAYCDVIFSGSIPPNPADLLENGRYKELITKLQKEYDYIILDTAPLMLVTDSFLIAENADVILYVTRSENTERSFIGFVNKNVKDGKLKNLAFVLNDVHKTNFGYGNKYGYGYHAEKKKWWNFKKD